MKQKAGESMPYLVELEKDEIQEAKLMEVRNDDDASIRCQSRCTAEEESDIRRAMVTEDSDELTAAIGKAFDIDEDLDKAARDLQVKLLMKNVEDQMRRGSGVGHKNPHE